VDLSRLSSSKFALFPESALLVIVSPSTKAYDIVNNQSDIRAFREADSFKERKAV
jgi:hypothetical protein